MNARSRKAEAKKARRRKRKATQEARWLPEAIADVIDDIGTRAELFDAVLLERGWTFDDVHSDDGLAAWYYEPSGLPTDDPNTEGVSRIWFTYDLDGESDGEHFPGVIHAVLVGTDGDHQFDDAGLLAVLDMIEAYRFGDPELAFE